MTPISKRTSAAARSCSASQRRYATSASTGTRGHSPSSSATTRCNAFTAARTGFLAEYDYRGSELVYSDPPYLLHTRTSQRRYRFDYEEADHVELLELLKTLPCQVMLSGYPSALYDAHLAGWRSVRWQVMNQGGVRTEQLWFNFVPDRVHWASHAGRNFTDRQRIKRKAASWGERYAAMPRAERLAVLAAMMVTEAEIE